MVIRNRSLITSTIKYHLVFAKFSIEIKITSPQKTRLVSVLWNFHYNGMEWNGQWTIHSKIDVHVCNAVDALEFNILITFEMLLNLIKFIVDTLVLIYYVENNIYSNISLDNQYKLCSNAMIFIVFESTILQK